MSRFTERCRRDPVLTPLRCRYEKMMLLPALDNLLYNVQRQGKISFYVRRLLYSNGRNSGSCSRADSHSLRCTDDFGAFIRGQVTGTFAENTAVW